jgi:hypothetical protein
MQAIYVLVSHRTWDHYFARFHGFNIGTDTQWWEGLDYCDDADTVAGAVQGLAHGDTAYLRLRTRMSECGSDELVVLRYDVPAAAKTTLYVQYTRWKYQTPTLVIVADHRELPPYPCGVSLHDCVYDVTLTIGADVTPF